MRTLAAAALLLLPCAAQASPRVDHLRPIAAQAFPGADRRCGTTAVLIVPELPTLADATPALCRIRLTDAAASLPRPFLCAVLVHEFGHIDLTADRSQRDSEDHSRDPLDIMYGGHFAHDRVPACNRLAFLERKLAALKRHVRRLVRLRRPRHRVVRVYRRIAAVAAELGP